MAGWRLGPGQRLRRAQRIGTTFGRIYLGLRAQRWLERTLRPADMDQRWRSFHEDSAQRIYDAAVELQGLILKGCQFLGTRADVLPPEWVERLSLLQDRVPPRPYAVVRATVERELGAEVGELFESFGPNAIASASLAQVHEARLRGGQRVAVKVQYPEIESLVRSDLRNLRALFRTVGWLERDFDVMPLVEELASVVPRELNFVNEGHNAETVARFFKDRDDVAVPRVHWELTTQRVLVTEFVDGIKITDRKRLKRSGLDTTAVARTLVEAYCEQIFVHGFFHADPHPGNLFVQRRPDGAPRIVFVDFGLTKELPSHFRDNALAFAAALLKGDTEEMAEAMLEVGFETRDGRAESLREIADLVLELARRFRHGVRLEQQFAERFGREVPERIRRNPIVRVPGHLVLVARVLGLLSGLNRSLDARLDLARTLMPYAMRAGSQSASGSGAASRPGNG